MTRVNSRINHVDILEVKVNCISKQSIIAKVKEWSLDNQSRTITYINAHCLNIAYKNEKYRSIINQSDLVYPDGISVVWSSRFLGGCRLEKVTGREWINDLCQLAADSDLRLYILAGAPGIAQKARENLLLKWPDLQITGTSDGYFLEKNSDQILREINANNPHILLVGMGSPQQEFWVSKHREQINARVCWSVGALFDYVAGAEPAVPAWMNGIGLEWLWRLIIDPVGKWKRYIIGNPLFVTRVLLQKYK